MIEIPRQVEDFKNGWKRTEDARRRSAPTELASRSSLSCFGRDARAALAPSPAVGGSFVYTLVRRT